MDWQGGSKDYSQQFEDAGLLGGGTYGTVILARHRRSGTMVAVKKMDLRRMRMLMRKDSVVKVRKEMEIHAQLKHPNIVRLYSWFEEADFYYLIMEPVRGGDLFDFLAGMEGEEVDEEDAKFMFLQLLAGVQYLHSHDIVHRDLKPENVMCADKSSRPRLKITDFGEAKALTGGSVCKTHIGTEQTMAPEVFLLKRKARGVKEVDGKIADMWGLGVVLYVVLVICYPFDSSEDESYRRQMIQLGEGEIQRPNIFRLTSWNNKSREVKELVDGLLKPKPDERWDVQQARECNWLKDRDTRRAGLRKTPQKVTPAKRKQLHRD